MNISREYSHFSTNTDVFLSTNTDVFVPVRKRLDEGTLQQCHCAFVVECAAQKRPELSQCPLVLSAVRAGRCVGLAVDQLVSEVVNPQHVGEGMVGHPVVAATH